MPFSGSKQSGKTSAYWTDFYNNYVRKTVTELGYKCERSTASARSIVGTIVSDLFQADVVLAVLTDHNPNVFYELGVRHALAHGTIMAIESGQEIPFDLSHFGVIHYDRGNRTDFKRELRRIIADVEKRTPPDNPVREFLSANEVGTVRIAADVSSTPLDIVGSLNSAQRDLMVVGQNLSGLANDDTRRRIFAALETTPRLKVRILMADSRCKPQIDALAQIIDEAMPKQFPKIDRAFQKWLSDWRDTYPAEANRLEIRRCVRVGNVSATLVDSGDQDGLILIRPVLYHTQPNARPCHWLGRNDSPRVFASYKSALEQIWSHGEPLA